VARSLLLLGKTDSKDKREKGKGGRRQKGKGGRKKVEG
jgi:hypothetical protein